ncbi:hypothetical protein K502DRAFT_326171 [Neoconidiobolus thromboides FSU 785]|nr:hypothetical protein K502DRAFT_326171 [Neoconidiobolus thromboides FSU 785]
MNYNRLNPYPKQRGGNGQDNQKYLNNYRGGPNTREHGRNNIRSNRVGYHHKSNSNGWPNNNNNNMNFNRNTYEQSYEKPNYNAFVRNQVISKSSKDSSKADKHVIIEKSRENPVRCLFIRNIESGTHESELLDFFTPFGEIKTTVYHDTKGVLYITFYDIRAAIQAKVSVDGISFKSKTLDVHYSFFKAGTDFTLPPAGIDNQGSIKIAFPSNSVPTEEYLYNFFSQFGEIEDIITCEIPSTKIISFFDARASHDVKHKVNWESFGVLPTAFDLAWDPRSYSQPEAGKVKSKAKSKTLSPKYKNERNYERNYYDNQNYYNEPQNNNSYYNNNTYDSNATPVNNYSSAYAYDSPGKRSYNNDDNNGIIEYNPASTLPHQNTAKRNSATKEMTYNDYNNYNKQELKGEPQLSQFEVYQSKFQINKKHEEIEADSYNPESSLNQLDKIAEKQNHLSYDKDNYYNSNYDNNGLNTNYYNKVGVSKKNDYSKYNEDKNLVSEYLNNLNKTVENKITNNTTVVKEINSSNENSWNETKKAPENNNMQQVSTLLELLAKVGDKK